MPYLTHLRAYDIPMDNRARPVFTHLADVGAPKLRVIELVGVRVDFRSYRCFARLPALKALIVSSPEKEGRPWTGRRAGNDDSGYTAAAPCHGEWGAKSVGPTSCSTYIEDARFAQV